VWDDSCNWEDGKYAARAPASDVDCALRYAVTEESRDIRIVSSILSYIVRNATQNCDQTIR